MRPIYKYIYFEELRRRSTGPIVVVGGECLLRRSGPGMLLLPAFFVSANYLCHGRRCAGAIVDVIVSNTVTEVIRKI